jgi:hypothetical protein
MVGNRLARRVLLAVVAVLCAACSASPTVDLTGSWSSADYTCPPGVLHAETFRIVQEDTHVVATKVVGDNCVPSGHDTFEGTVVDHAGTVDFWMGAEGGTPAIALRGAQLTVIDPSHFRVVVPGGDLTYVRTDEPGILGAWLWIVVVLLALGLIGTLLWRRRRRRGLRAAE